MAAERHVRPLARLASPAGGSHVLVARRAAVGWAFSVEQVGAEGAELARGAIAGVATTSALGIDRDGFLVYAEGPGAREALTAAGVEVGLDLGAPALAFETDEGGAGPDGHPRTLEGGVALLAEEAPRAEVLFPDNAPIPYSRWGYLQGQRVRYFPSEPPRFVRPEE
jgi:hypothetical protein